MKKDAVRILLAFGLLLSLGHGSTESGSGCESHGCGSHPGGVCEGFTQLELGYTASGTCTPGPLALHVDASCVATLTLPDGSTWTGTYAQGLSTFETAMGTCTLDRYTLAYQCASDGGVVCSSSLVSSPLGDGGVDASVDASVVP